jgi:hypothetical protein
VPRGRDRSGKLRLTSARRRLGQEAPGGEHHRRANPDVDDEADSHPAKMPPTTSPTVDVTPATAAR